MPNNKTEVKIGTDERFKDDNLSIYCQKFNKSLKNIKLLRCLRGGISSTPTLLTGHILISSQIVDELSPTS